MSPSDAFLELIDIVKTLRGPNGCPWDREQTLESLTPYIIEEAYELVDAMKAENFANLEEELGDVLLHVVMLGLMAEETDHFTIDTVIKGISDKMVRRHPHVFGNVSVASSDEVVQNWEAIKRQEPGKETGILDSIPKQLPAVMQSQKLQKKASKIGFDWPDSSGALAKVSEELTELTEAISGQSPENIREEFGDLLFSIVNVGRKLGIDCEAALQDTNIKFRTRFKAMETAATASNQPIAELNLDQLDALWNQAKKG
jgi:tetrapyrrole methylase family protein/MazG family protein